MSNAAPSQLSALQAKMARSLIPSEPVMATVTEPAPVASIPVPVPAPRESKPAKREEQPEGTIARTFKVDPGKATVAVTVRLPRDLHAELRILTLQMQIEDASRAQSMNDLILEAVKERLKKLRAA